jgi:hypothetical protein
MGYFEHVKELSVNAGNSLPRWATICFCQMELAVCKRGVKVFKTTDPGRGR